MDNKFLGFSLFHGRLTNRKSINIVVQGSIKPALISISAPLSWNKYRNNIVDQTTTMASKKEAAHTASCGK